MALLQDLPAHSIAMPSINGQRASRLLVANTGATDHMLPDKLAFISYHPAANHHVHMGNNSFAPILGTGSAVITINKKRILIQDCLHVPALCNPLYSLCAHHHQHGCGFLGMYNLGIFIFFPTFIFFVFFSMFILEVNTETDCHLSYEPIAWMGKLPSLNYVQPIPIVSSSLTTMATPSTPAVIEDGNDADAIPFSYAGHWPKQPKWPAPHPAPTYDMSLIPPPFYLVCLKDLTREELISHLYLLETSPSLTSDSSSPKTASLKTDMALYPDTSSSRPFWLDCMAEDKIVMILHHPGTRLPPIRQCNTPDASKNKTTYTPEELHHLTGCRHFHNYQYTISTSKDGTLLNSDKFPLYLGSYATILKAPRGKPFDHLPSKYLDIVHVGIAFGDCVSVGGFKYTLIFVDQAPHYSWTFGLKFLQHSDILLAFLLFWDKAGSLARQF
jgi:hypothetical protein